MACKNIIHLFRAVGYVEYLSIVKTKKFSLRPNGLEAKYFGMDFNETLDFANKVFNVHVVAIIKITIDEHILNKIGDFTMVDTTVFKKGTVEIDKVCLDKFNNSIIDITHLY